MLKVVDPTLQICKERPLQEHGCVQGSALTACLSPGQLCCSGKGIPCAPPGLPSFPRGHVPPRTPRFPDGLPLLAPQASQGRAPTAQLSWPGTSLFIHLPSKTTFPTELLMDTTHECVSSSKAQENYFPKDSCVD